MAYDVRVLLIQFGFLGAVSAVSQCSYFVKTTFKTYSYYYETDVIQYRKSTIYQSCPDRCCNGASAFNVCCYDDSYLIYKDTNSGFSIAGIIIGCILGFVILMIIILCCCKAAKRRQVNSGRVLNTRQNIAVIAANPGSQSGSFYYPSAAPPPSYESVVKCYDLYGGVNQIGGESSSDIGSVCNIGGGGERGSHCNGVGGDSGGGCDSGGGDSGGRFDSVGGGEGGGVCGSG